MVIAIIAILAAILFPVFAQAREKARAISCLSNEKQIGTALMMYVQDYDETYFNQAWPGGCPQAETGYFTDNPLQPRQHWATLLYAYVKSGQIYHCPDYSGQSYRASYAIWTCGEATKKNIVPFVEYGINEALLAKSDPNTGAPITTSMAQIQSPASIGLIGENNYIHSWRQCLVGPADTKVRQYWTMGDPVNYFYYQTPARHSGGMNFTYADGHAKWARGTITGKAGVASAYYGYYPVLETDDQYDTVAACGGNP